MEELADTVRFTKHVLPDYSAYLMRVPGGMKSVFVSGGARVHKQDVPRNVYVQLKAQLAESNRRVSQNELAGGTIVAAAHLPASMIQLARNVPPPTTRITLSKHRIRVSRPSKLGEASEKDTTRGYDYIKCDGRVNNPFTERPPKYSRCDIRPQDFRAFAAALSSGKKTLQLEGNTLCDKMSSVLGALSKSVRIVRFLGAGANGITFLAVDPSNKEFAVKVVAENTRPSEKKPTVLNEIEAQRLFAALGLAPRIHQATSLQLGNKTVHVIVMDRVHITLRDLLCYQRLSVDSLQSLAVGIAKLVWKMHKAGFTHGDMHPENIMLRYDKRTGKFTPLLIDFGFSTTKFNNPLVDVALFVAELKTMRVPAPIVTYFHTIMTEVVSAILRRHVDVPRHLKDVKPLLVEYQKRMLTP